MRLYTSLNDAAATSRTAALAPGTTLVWYVRPELFAEFAACSVLRGHEKLRQMFDVAHPDRTHIRLGAVASDNPDHLWFCLQGEQWSPNGEARKLIRRLGLQHTSMSVGDCVEIGESFWMAAPIGWLELKREAA